MADNARWRTTAASILMVVGMDADDAAAVRRLLDKDHIIDLVHWYSYCVDHGSS